MDKAKLEKAIDEKCRHERDRLIQVGRDQSKKTTERLISMVEEGIKASKYCNDAKEYWRKSAKKLLKEIENEAR